MNERAEAMIALLARQDADDAQRRHVLRYPGAPERFALLRVQPTVYAVHAQVARENAR